MMIKRIDNRALIATIVFIIVTGILLFDIDYSDLKSKHNYPLYTFAIGFILGYIAILVSGALKADRFVIKVAEIAVPILLIEVILTYYIYETVSDFQNIYIKILLLLSILVPVFWLSRRT